MSLGPAKTAIRSYIEAGFTTAPLVWPNEAHDLPATPAAFVAVEVQGVSNAIRGVGQPGNRLFIHGGVILANVYVPFSVGSTAGDDLADAIGLLLTRATSPRQALRRSFAPRTRRCTTASSATTTATTGGSASSCRSTSTTSASRRTRPDPALGKRSAAS